MTFKIERGQSLTRAIPMPGETFVVIPEHVLSIGQYAFSQCRDVKEIILPEKLIRIERNAFQNCTSLEQIHIPQRTSVIEESAFSGCCALRQLTLPEGIPELAPRTFFGCTSLKELHLPASMLSIGRQAFMNCTALTRVTLGELLLLFGEEIFEGCTSLTELLLEIDGITYNAAAAAPSKLLGQVILTMRGREEQRMWYQQETRWLAYHGCGFTPLLPKIKANAAGYLARFMEEKRWDDIEALFAESLVTASCFDKTLADYWSPERVGAPWRYYILRHKSERALALLQKHCTHSLAKIVMSNDVKTLSALIGYGWLTKKNIDEMVQLAIEHECVEVQSMLLSFKNREGLYQDPAKALML